MTPRSIAGLLALAVVLSVPAVVISVAPSYLPPDQAVKTFKVSPGLQMTVWASEPMFVNPTCFDIDHKGRAWVCESVNYRNKLRGKKTLTRPAGDRIVVLEDDKGSGKATRATTFYQSPSILAPLGIAVAPYPDGKGVRVFVCQSPDILVFEDADGDNKADGPPKKLLTKFGGLDHDHGVHGILIGPDRKLYFSVGDGGVHGLQSSDGKGRKWHSNGTDCRAGTVWRCELDGTKLELVAHNFRNNYEPAVDSFGNVFISDNDDDGNQQTRICHVIPGGDYGYHPRRRGDTHWHEEQPGVVPKILRTYFGSPTGMCIYEGKLLPKKYHGQPLHTDAGPRHVRAYHLQEKGASYEVNREDIVTSTDVQFRPSDVCVGPDGSVYVADWHDPVVGGHDMRDGKGGLPETGRIYRLAPKGHTVANPKIDVSTGKGTLAALNSPNLAARALAMAKLAEMKKEDALELLEPAAARKDDPVLRARALWQVARVGGKSARSKALDAAFNDKDDPRFQALAIRLAKDHLAYDSKSLTNYIGGVKRVFGSPPSVLREGLIALRDVPPEASKETIYALMKHYDGKDRFYLASVGIAVGHHDRARRNAILADFGKHFPAWDGKVAGLAWELRPPGLVPKLARHLADDKLTSEQRVAVLDALASSDDPSAGAAVLASFKGAPPAMRQRVLEHLQSLLPTKWAGLKRADGVKDIIADLLKSPETRVAGLGLVATAGRIDLAATVLERAGPKEPLAVRKAAIAALGQLPGRDSLKALQGLADDKDEAAAAAALLAVGEMGRRDAFAAEAAAVLEKFLTAKPALRDAAVVGLAAGRKGSLRLFELHQMKKLPADAVPAVGRLLRSSPYPDLKRKAAVLFPAPGKIDPKKLPSVAELASRKGNAPRGRKLFEASLKSNLQCAKCHMVRGQGGQIGPDLSMIGKKHGREGLLESILNPSKAIADQYLVWEIQTTRGLSVQGLIVEDGPAGVVIRDAEGRDTRIKPGDIEKRIKSMKSLMPEDLVAHLTPGELVDLVEYMLTLRQASLTVTRWHIIGPFDNEEGMKGLDREFPPEKGIDLKASYPGKGGKAAWKTIQAGANGYIDLEAWYAKRAAQTVSYLACEVESPEAQTAELLLGSDDGCKVWVNGKLVHTARLTRAAAPEQDRVTLRLKKGANRIVVKINNGDGPHGLFFTLATEKELKMGALK